MFLLCKKNQNITCHANSKFKCHHQKLIFGLPNHHHHRQSIITTTTIIVFVCAKYITLGKNKQHPKLKLFRCPVHQIHVLSEVLQRDPRRHGDARRRPDADADVSTTPSPLCRTFRIVILCFSFLSLSLSQIKKDQFKEMKNDHLELEPFLDCLDCGRKQHQICVLYLEQIWPGGFVCDNCLKKKGTKRKDNKSNAKRLPTSKLGTYIETRVNNFLKKKEAGAGEVHIRVVSSSDKMVEVKPGMRSRFVDNNEMLAEFPYRAKALFAFEEVDGIDVCFFGMHVQEYGSECAAPNTRRVYIAYLDSVHFFQPRQYRTSVYHEILLGYMDYAKQLGYTMAHIWACPPSEGDDYIFHCHPPEQRIPKPKRLQEWYKKMLDKGMVERTIQDYKDILKQAMEDKLQSASELPYFEGDFWPNVLEESIKELDQEEEEKRKQAEREEAAANAVSWGGFCGVLPSGF